MSLVHLTGFQIFLCLLLSSSTSYQTFKHGFQISKHVRACRHVKIGPEVQIGLSPNSQTFATASSVSMSTVATHKWCQVSLTEDRQSLVNKRPPL